MKKNILIHGLIAGALVSGFMLFMIGNYSYCEGNVDMSYSMLLGYASMLIAFSLVFVGIRNYRNKYNNGVISFGKAFKIGFMIALIASTMYVIAWMFDYHYFVPDFAEKYSARILGDLKAAGASAAEIESKTKEMADFTRMYKNPLFVILMTYVEILPVGIIVSLISALILKRKTAPAKA
ncbi:MAG: DUF4199 domain-containing protein [Ferruginibacter sp.]